MDEFNVLHFDNGVSYLVDDETYKWFVKKRPFLGRPNDTGGELFGAPSDEIDKALQESGVDKRKLEQILGLPSNTFGDGSLHRMNYHIHTVRMGVVVHTMQKISAFWIIY